MGGVGLNRKADMKTLMFLYRRGLMDDGAFKSAQAILRPSIQWFDWVRRNLLFWGCALILSGILFFFAFNWENMGKFLKFGAIEAGILCCVLGVHVSGLNRLGGKLFLLCASVLVGVFLAVFGQTYQTGADAYQLFTGWALLIAGWVLISEFAGLWMIWIILLNTGLILYVLQVERFGIDTLYLASFALNGTALFLGEWGAAKDLDWLSGKWHRIILLLAGLTALTIPCVLLIFDVDNDGPARGLALCAWLLTLFGGYAWYRHRTRDLASLTLLVMNGSFMILLLIGKVLFESDEGPGIFLIYGLVIFGVITGCVIWLKRISATMTLERQGGTP